MLVVFPPFDEISTLQVLQVALLSSFLVKCNQTFERLYRLSANVYCWLLAALDSPRVSYATCVVMSFAPTGIDKGIICKIGKQFQGIETLGTGSQQEPVFDSHP